MKPLLNRMFSLNDVELIARVTVWHALSELFTGRELQEYDYQWMAEVLKKSRLNREEIFRIVDEEVTPALQANLLYNPTPVMDGWSEEDIKRLVTAYLKRMPTIIERIISARLLLKQRRKHISKELNGLSAELDKGVIS